MNGFACARAAAMLTLVAALAPTPAAEPGAPAPDDDAARFGAQEIGYSAALSADGKRMVFVAPIPTGGTVAMVDDFAAHTVKPIGTANGKPLNLQSCDWSGTNRLVCVLWGATYTGDRVRMAVQRLMAADADGRNVVMLGQGNESQQRYARQFDGEIVDWRNGVDGVVLIERRFVPETGRTAAHTDEGVGVDRIDTSTGKAVVVERPEYAADKFISDGLGNIRVKTLHEESSDGRLTGTSRHYYRKAGDREWLPLGVDRQDGPRMIPLAVDPIVNAAYVLQNLDGRLALYRFWLDGSLQSQLVFASPNFDADDVVRVGRNGRVIGVSYVTDRRITAYFDPDYKGIAAGLSNALPKLPLLHFVSASADERTLLIRASSDTDPGRYYLLDRDHNSLTEVMQARPPLKDRQLSRVRAVEYAAADGTRIPGYLTLPPGITEAKGLPAIVMPHGGPEARDEWGFDWLAQFFAQRGYAVMQPNFRGSAGYGDAWFAQNGFQGWKQSIGDICDAGRWLIAQGIADPAKLAIVGWSYGGYAALQANVLDPDLFKAAVAIAPVTDLALLKTESDDYTNSLLVRDFIGSGPHVREGSPAQQADKFKAPVLMFHGQDDYQVDIVQSQRMDKALRDAGKSSQLVTYPGLDHGLRSNVARGDMLRKSDAFLRAHLGLK